MSKKFPNIPASRGEFLWSWITRVPFVGVCSPKMSPVEYPPDSPGKNSTCVNRPKGKMRHSTRKPNKRNSISSQSEEEDLQYYIPILQALVPYF
jgi:hypothetical protein